MSPPSKVADRPTESEATPCDEFAEPAMGWTFEGGLPVDGHWSYHVARVHDAAVAGHRPLPPLVPDVQASWGTQVRVDSIVDSVKTAESAGATVVLESFDAGPADLDRTVALAELLQGSVLRPAAEAPAGRSAVLADRVGAPFSVTQAPTAPTAPTIR
jgi:predicted enzyme related to lactoylglutathione lyase